MKEIVVSNVGTLPMSELFKVKPRQFPSVGSLVRAILEGEEELQTLAIKRAGTVITLSKLSYADSGFGEQVITGVKTGTKAHDWSVDGTPDTALSGLTLNQLIDGEIAGVEVLKDGRTIIIDQPHSVINFVNSVDVSTGVAGGELVFEGVVAEFNLSGSESFV